MLRERRKEREEGRGAERGGAKRQGWDGRVRLVENSQPERAYFIRMLASVLTGKFGGPHA